MKIVRFRSQNGEELYEAFDPEMPDEARIIEGDIFGDIEVTKRRKQIEAFLPPVWRRGRCSMGRLCRVPIRQTCFLTSP